MSISRTTIGGTLLTAAVLLPALATASACSLWSSNPPPAPSDAVNVNVGYTFSSGGATNCTGSITWVFTPISLTGSMGRTQQITDQQSYDVSADGTDDRCTFSVGELGLKKGTWQIQGGVAGTCRVNLTTAYTTVFFRQGVAGCTTG